MKLRLVLAAVLLACSGITLAADKAAAEAPKMSYAEANKAKLKAMGAVIGVEAADAAAPAAAAPADEATALGIAKANNCLACHSIETNVVGPAWRDVGKKYTGDAEAKAKLLAKVKQGGKGVWGEVPMPPNPTINEADLESMVGFILTLQ